MNINTRKIIITLLLILYFILSMCFPAYAETSTSDKEDLVELLNEYKEQLGNLNEFKTVVDKTYNDLNSATKVTDELKETLINDINMLDNVSDMDPFVLEVLKSELTSQVNNDLNDDTLSEMQDEITTIKDWTNEQVQSSSNNANDDNNKPNPSSSSTPTSSTTNNKSNLANKILPYAGINNIIIILTILLLTISIIISIIKSKQLKQVK